VADAAIVGRGPRFFVIRSGEFPAGMPATIDPVAAGRSALSPVADRVPSFFVEVLRTIPSGDRLVAESEELAAALRPRLNREVGVADRAARRAARARLPSMDGGEEKSFLLALGHARLEQALRAPEEILITFAREEERLERAVGREERAAEAFLALERSPLAEYGTAWATVRRSLAEHHHQLEEALARSARSVVPNLSAVVGERVAARLVAAGGGVAALGRMRAPRLQLLGSRRRPSPERGPRYGVIYRAARMTDVPIGRRGAYARSLAALAVIAARADATTRRDLSPVLLARRDRRIEQLRRRRG
jgi:nucleolar protein 56